MKLSTLKIRQHTLIVSNYPIMWGDEDVLIRGSSLAQGHTPKSKVAGKWKNNHASINPNYV